MKSDEKSTPSNGIHKRTENNKNNIKFSSFRRGYPVFTRFLYALQKYIINTLYGTLFQHLRHRRTFVDSICGVEMFTPQSKLSPTSQGIIWNTISWMSWNSRGKTFKKTLIGLFVFQHNYIRYTKTVISSQHNRPHSSFAIPISLLIGSFFQCT